MDSEETGASDASSVLSELMRPGPGANVVDWVAAPAASALCLSTVSQAELLYDVVILPPGRRRDRLLEEVEGMLREDFDGRILPFDSAAAQAYAVIAAARRASGRPINHAECQIAAIARCRDASIATRDLDSFAGSGGELINLWTIG